MTDPLPLRNVRVADFTWAAAGPYATLLLASLGAEVVKVTSSRATGGFPKQRAADIDRYLNYNKLGITLDLKTPQGVGLAKELIGVCDLVVENYRPRTMERFGLGYQDLLQVKPDIIMVSGSSLGAEGPQSRYTGFAPIFGTMSGLSHVTGYADGIPTELRLMVDYTVGQATAYAALVALYHLRTTGQGQYIDLASRDAITCLIGEFVLEDQLNGHVSGAKANPRIGNKDLIMAPHGAYRCKGEDAWITIAVATQEEWEALCGAMERPEWLSDRRFADGHGRWTHQEELDGHIGAWTEGYIPFELMDLLQERGVAAVPSYSARDLFEDGHLVERLFSQKVGVPSGDEYTVINAPWLLNGHRPEAKRPAPAPGEHNTAVLEELLGVPPKELESLTEEGIAS